ncbi:MAG TPA: 1-(5-phosphoribosyl)-5-[(5-phosphoribosylamino)methylideneamino] imidazole-4-carboxamide isomerase [Candidatus Limnocylindrales bacterium]|nr:1-(5-phosphoribosyl)-5-[(5-phosphoribosylamino)methylideneamino] imidazole-4-carboxamide isomerase [Candidatus Limnocylindrales bacterium]
MSSFEILPAIDLRAGRVVRLVEGDFERETVYEGEPAAAAAAFAAAGARWLHVVDLDGARAGRPCQLDQVAAIVSAAAGRASCQVAGGLRSAEDVAAALGRGAARVVLGTAALRAPELVARLVERHGAERIAVAIDVRDRRARGDAWHPDERDPPAVDVLHAMADAGVETFAVTAIERDGRLAGPDLTLLAHLVGLGRGRILASGGISSLDDLRRVVEAGCAGAIIGRAVHEGRLSLAEALDWAARKGRFD